MTSELNQTIFKSMGFLFKSHPWHGVFIGEDIPNRVTTYIEIVPTDTVKYEIDKATGHLKIDRPQRFSNVCPTLYGFIPQTYCAERVGALCQQKTGRSSVIGDEDPLDICVLSEKVINHGNILLQAIPIGGLRLIDGNEADDKIIAVMKDDACYGGWRDLSDCPPLLIERLRHYFLTYKDLPGSEQPKCELDGMYGREEAHEVIHKSHLDYITHFGEIKELLAQSSSK